MCLGKDGGRCGEQEGGGGDGGQEEDRSDAENGKHRMHSEVALEGFSRARPRVLASYKGS